MEIVLNIVFLVVAFVLLSYGTKYFLRSGLDLAQRLGLPQILLSLTVISGSSVIPTIVVNSIAAARENTELAIGNTVGNIIIDLILVFGISSLFAPVVIKKDVVWREIPMIFLSLVVLLIISADEYLRNESGPVYSRDEGLLLICFFLVYLYYISRIAYHQHQEQDKEDGIRAKLEERRKAHPLLKTFFIVFLSILALYAAGQLIVLRVPGIASDLGLSQYLVSVSFIALGSSIPTIFTSISASRAKEQDLSIGTTIGTTILYAFLVFGITILIQPFSMTSSVLFDLLYVVGGLVVFFVLLMVGRRYTIERWQGIVMISLYVLYLVLIVLREIQK